MCYRKYTENTEKILEFKAAVSFHVEAICTICAAWQSIHNSFYRSRKHFGMCKCMNITDNTQITMWLPKLCSVLKAVTVARRMQDNYMHNKYCKLQWPQRMLNDGNSHWQRSVNIIDTLLRRWCVSTGYCSIKCATLSRRGVLYSLNNVQEVSIMRKYEQSNCDKHAFVFKMLFIFAFNTQN